jgi:hypothetical protein
MSCPGIRTIVRIPGRSVRLFGQSSRHFKRLRAAWYLLDPSRMMPEPRMPSCDMAFPYERLTIYWSLVEFHARALQWIPAVTGSLRRRSRVESLIERAVLYVVEASECDDERAPRLLRRARVEILKASALFTTSYRKKLVAEASYRHSRLWVERLCRELAFLMRTPVREWFVSEPTAIVTAQREEEPSGTPGVTPDVVAVVGRYTEWSFGPDDPVSDRDDENRAVVTRSRSHDERSNIDSAEPWAAALQPVA